MTRSAALTRRARVAAVRGIKGINQRHDGRGEHHPHHQPREQKRHFQHERLRPVEKDGADQHSEKRQRGEPADHGVTYGETIGH